MNEDSPNPEINYDIYFIKKVRWILALITIFIIIVISNIPLTKTLDSLIYGNLSFGRCKINLSNYEVNILPLPHLNFQNIKIPGRCINQRQTISLKELKIYFRLISLAPFGPHFKIETAYNGNPLNFFLSSNFTFTHIKVLMEENDISLEKFSNFFSDIKVSGKVKTDAIVELENMQLSLLQLNLQSKTLNIPGQNINGLNTPDLPLKNLLLTVDAKNPNKKIEIKQLIIGDENSPIRAEFSGVLKPGAAGITNSNINIQGQLAFSEEFSKNGIMFLINGALSKIDKVDDFYQIQLNGTLTRFPQNIKMSSRK